MNKISFLNLGLSVGVVACAAVFSVGCSTSKASYMTNPAPTYESYTESGGSMVFDVTPKAEIIFVVDNSESMNKHIAQMTASIDKFVDAFSKNNPLQYHLAVVSVYDHRTYDSQKYKDEFKTADGFKILENGEFHPVRSSPTSIVADKYFISSDDTNPNDPKDNNYLKTLLKNTINTGVQDLDKGGPEFEESFSPIAAAYGFSTKDKLSKDVAARQKGFFMGPDAYKVVFFVTDATDDSYITGSELYYNLVARSNGDKNKVLAFGAIVPTNDNSCSRDPGGPPKKIEDFLSLATKNNDGANVVSLCGDFGAKLATFGAEIRAQTANKIIPLKNSIPVISTNPKETLHVCYGAEKAQFDPNDMCKGSQEIPFELTDDIVGFRYDPDTNSIRLNPELELNPETNGKLRVVYTSANATNSRMGRVNRFGDSN